MSLSHWKQGYQAKSRNLVRTVDGLVADIKALHPELTMEETHCLLAAALTVPTVENEIFDRLNQWKTEEP